VLYSLGLTRFPNESLYLKVEVSQHKQISIIRRTPVLLYGRSFVAAHFSLETMMAGKMLACLDRNFQTGKVSSIKGRDFYDLLWFMQQRIQPLERKTGKRWKTALYGSVCDANSQWKISKVEKEDLAGDLLSLFEQRTFIEAWLEECFNENFGEYVKYYLQK